MVEDLRDSSRSPSSANTEPESRLSFRARLTIALVAVAVLPLAGFGLLLLIIGGSLVSPDPNIARLVLFALATVTVGAIVVSFLLVADLTAPLRGFAAAVDRVSAGDLSTPIVVAGEDELAQLAASHNRLASDLERRNRQLGRILTAIQNVSPSDGVDFLAVQAAEDAKAAFGMIDSTVYLGDVPIVPEDEAVPGVSRRLRVTLSAGGEVLGVLLGRLPATSVWEKADRDLLELFAIHVSVAIRNAELFARVEAQNAQLLALNAAKDDFLRGVSHNLQTPLTSIRAYAEQLDADYPDQRLRIVAEQTDRLSRMVRQLLTVARLEAGTLRPRADVLTLAGRARKAWEALGADDVPFTLQDRSDGWLAMGDADQVDQVLWALLDNAIKYGGRRAVDVEVAADPEASVLRLTITDAGPGVSESDRERMFGRFERGTGREDDGSGLGLYVSRELCRAMDGDLILETARSGHGAAFTIELPGELATEG